MFGLFLASLTYSTVLGLPPLEERSQPSDRIVGGKKANIVDYPYQLCLLLEGYGQVCGASLIDEQWALTAAHCTYGEVAEDITIRAGSSRSASGGQLVKVAMIYEHEDYDDYALHNDIALLKLASKITVEHSKIISLATRKPIAGQIATITGWGKIHEKAIHHSPVLRVAQVSIVDQEDCRIVYSDELIPDTVLCAGLLYEGGKDTCQGDSGGPLVVNGVLAGVTSWAMGCARPYKPGVYTDVTSFLDWIRKTKTSDWCSSLHTYYRGTLI